MKRAFIYVMVSASVILASCGNSNKESAAHVDSAANTPESIDTTLSKTENAVDLDTADQAFFENAAYGGMVEVESSNKILQETNDSRVKELAEMMVTDHTGANAGLKVLAEQKGYRLPNSLPKF
jgi:putative membrane protein